MRLLLNVERYSLVNTSSPSTKWNTLKVDLQLIFIVEPALNRDNGWLQQRHSAYAPKRLEFVDNKINY